VDTNSPLLKLSHVGKTYGSGDTATPVLKDISLDVQTGDALAIVGPSGCGKSTLLNLIGLLDTPSTGEITFKGEGIAHYNEAARANFRNRSIGFVFQLHHLLPQCTALENVLVPTLAGKADADAPERARQLLDRVGLSHRIDHRPGQLSGGERQRVAVVRALINRPDLLLADEPTGALSEEGSESLTTLLLELNAEHNMALIVVTHARDVAARMNAQLVLKAGQLVDQGATP
jgi:lipoprotein-releasing system ATP-binding protein